MEYGLNMSQKFHCNMMKGIRIPISRGSNSQRTRRPIGVFIGGGKQFIFVNSHNNRYISCRPVDSLLTDVVVLTPSDEILPSAYPSAKLNSATSTNQNLPSKFWKVTSVDLGAE